MNQLKRESPIQGEPWISIHDMHISQIICREKSVVFYFENGFDLIDNGQLIHKSKGRIELLGCNSSDLSCNIIKRRATRNGEKLYGRSASLEEINQMISKGKKIVEIFLELYDFNHFYWRGELLPYNRISKHLLAPIVTFETMGFFPMIYSWE